MVFKAQDAKSRMEQLGIFKSINVNIDVSKGICMDNLVMAQNVKALYTLTN